MKKGLLYTVLFFGFAAIFPNCWKRHPRAPDHLPAITQEGKNTFGCKVNGNLWVPFFPCGSFSNPCREMQIAIVPVKPPSKLPLFVWIDVGNQARDHTIFNISFSCRSTGNIYDSLTMEFLDFGPYERHRDKPGFFEITKLDTINGIVSGIFELNLYQQYDSVKITEGRFDFKFGTYCQCTK